MIPAFVTLALLQASPNSKLDEARAQVDDFEFAGALKTLDLALAVTGNDRETTLAILELQGIVWGNLNKGPKARSAFITLLTLDPNRKLSGDHPPRVRTPFYEAKEIVTRLGGGLALERQPLQKEAGIVSFVGVIISHDSSKLVRKVRFHTQVGDQSHVADLAFEAPGKAKVAAAAPEVHWWVELLGDKDAVLMMLGSASQPLVDNAVEPPKPEAFPPPPAAPPPELVKAPEAPGGPPAWLRPLGVGFGVGALVAGGVGGYFAYSSDAARSSIANATRDSTMAITSITQRQAQANDRVARDSALVANTLLGTAAGLLGVGIVLFAVGGHEDVAVAPTGTGVTVSGRF